MVCNSVLIDFNKHLEVSWDNVQFFYDKYRSLTPVNGNDTAKLYDEFTDYQTLSNNKILNTASDDAKVVDDEEDVYLLNGYFAVARVGQLACLVYVCTPTFTGIHNFGYG